MRKNKKYSPEFKISCILDMREHNLGYRETIRKHFDYVKGKENNFITQIKLWERIFLEEGEAGFCRERRGRTRKMDNPRIGRPRKLKKEIKDDLIAEYQRLKEENLYLTAENDYLKKLDALIRAEEQKKKRK